MFVSVPIIRPAIIGVANARTLSMSVVQLPNRTVGLAANVIASWATARPAGEVVPSGGRILDLRIYPDLHPNKTLFSHEVTNIKYVNEIASMIDGLPTDQEVTNCPAILRLPGDHQPPSTSISFTFRATRRGPPLVRADVTASATLPPTGCNDMTFAVRGRIEPALLGGEAVIAAASRLLHVQLSRRQPAGP
jgi:hypothetical protein